MKCYLCDDLAVAIFYFSNGCYHYDSKIQSLCAHHSYNSEPRYGTMELIQDLTTSGEEEGKAK